MCFAQTLHSSYLVTSHSNYCVPLCVTHWVPCAPLPMDTVWSQWSNPNYNPQIDLPVYNSAGRITSRLVTTTVQWYMEPDDQQPSSQSPCLKTCYQILGWAKHQDADFKLWQCVLQASPPGLLPILPCTRS